MSCTCCTCLRLWILLFMVGITTISSLLRERNDDWKPAALLKKNLQGSVFAFNTQTDNVSVGSLDSPSSFPSSLSLPLPTLLPSVSLKSSSPSFPPHTPEIISSNASFTFYISYPPCCKDQANYDPTAPTEECTRYSGCVYAGLFESIGARSLSFVES
jgi:hypothetical protein